MTGRIRLFGYITLAFFLIEDVNAQKIANASLKVGDIVLDGKLNEVDWTNAEATSDLTQFSPNPGYKCSQRTEIRILYDDEAIYIGAQMFDSAPDSILMQYSQRDQIKNSDEFGIQLSPYNDGINGVSFATTPAGILVDVNISPTGKDFNWDAVWDVETLVDENGWTAEYKIPWSALRFSKMEKGEEIVWGVNFYRKIRRFREFAVWEPMDPTSKVEGMRENGELHGLAEITPPPRITLFPYLSAYSESMEGGNLGNRFNGGLDFKAGIGDAFTLDMTLIPDFSGVRSDDQVLNLSPFEVRFDENRQFFTEGVELFSKAGLFYSRRIGSTPGNITGNLGENEDVTYEPPTAQLINATKVTGRTNGGLGIGFFNAITDVTRLTVEDSETGEIREIDGDPRTNFNVIVLDQNLRNNLPWHRCRKIYSFTIR